MSEERNDIDIRLIDYYLESQVTSSKTESVDN